TARHLNVDHAILEARAMDEVFDDVFPVGTLHVDRNANGCQTALETGHVLRHPKWPTRIGWHHIVDAVAKNEPAIEHRHLGIGQTQIFAIEIDNAVVVDTFNHGSLLAGYS